MKWKPPLIIKTERAVSSDHTYSYGLLHMWLREGSLSRVKVIKADND